MEALAVYEEPLKKELIDGKIVFMSPRATPNHNSVIVCLTRIFSQYLRGKTCRVFIDTDVYLTKKDHFVPDIIIVCDRNKIKHNGIHGAPDLVVEVLSRSTANYDRGHKKNIYAQSGVKEYWLIAPFERTIEVHLLKDGQYIIDRTYAVFFDYELEDMEPQYRSQVVETFSPSIFPDMNIVLEEIFENVILNP